jgi:hypothetical protein
MNASAEKILIGAIAVGLVTAGCATESTTYRTVSGPPQTAPETPAASYPIPATDPKGMAYVMSLGGEPMAAPSGQQGYFLHLRIAAENRSDAAAWTIDAHDQIVTMATEQLRPTYAQGSAGGSVVTVPQGQHGYLDVFYPLPAQANPGQATLSWQIHRGNDGFAQATPFALQPSQSPDYIDYRPAGVTVEYWPAGWWGVGFYSPFWWGPGLGYPYYWGNGYGWGHGHPGGGWRGAPAPHTGSGGWRGSPAPSRGFGGGGRGWRGMRR